jgi:hypothetical protein
MKKLMIVFSFLLIGICVQAKSFWKPVPHDLFKLKTVQAGNTGIWLFRPSVEITALQFTVSSDKAKVFDVTTLSQAGVGFSYQHFVDANGTPFNNYGFNALFLFGADLNGQTPASVSAAVTVNALQYINIGLGYNFGIKKMFLLTGVVFHFN